MVDTGESAGAANTFTLEGYVTVDAYHYDEATGTYIHFYHDEGSNIITNIGKEWVELQLGSDSPDAVSAQYISLSNSTDGLDAAWEIIPTEIAASGLTRALGDYLTTGTTGEWTITETFTATAGVSARLAGLNWESTGTGNLMAADTFTLVTLADQDTLTVTWTITIS